MAEENMQASINGVDRHLIAKMVDNQVTRFADHFRMLQFWRRLLAGDNDPEEIAHGLCQALSSGRYVKAPDAAGSVTNNITIHLPQGADVGSLADALAKALPPKQ